MQHAHLLTGCITLYIFTKFTGTIVIAKTLGPVRMQLCITDTVQWCTACRDLYRVHILLMLQTRMEHLMCVLWFEALMGCAQPERSHYVSWMQPLDSLIGSKLRNGLVHVCWSCVGHDAHLFRGIQCQRVVRQHAPFRLIHRHSCVHNFPMYIRKHVLSICMLSSASGFSLTESGTVLWGVQDLVQATKDMKKLT